MTTIRNILICIGAYWLTRWLVGPLDLLFSKFTDRIIYGDSVLYAIAMGVATSLPRTVAAILAGVLIVFIAIDVNPERWSLLVAALYVLFSGLRVHWFLPPTPWYRVWQITNVLFPAIACIIAAFATAAIRGKRSRAERVPAT
jgi:hypothetical protein